MREEEHAHSNSLMPLLLEILEMVLLVLSQDWFWKQHQFHQRRSTGFELRW
jgi:hypothetical protein